jgi:hypothetical protein
MVETDGVSVLNAVMVTSEEYREDSNGEPIVFCLRSGFAGTILAGLFDSSPSHFCAYSFHRNVAQQQSDPYVNGVASLCLDRNLHHGQTVA